jgi:hypothetical protein
MKEDLGRIDCLNNSRIAFLEFSAKAHLDLSKRMKLQEDRNGQLITKIQSAVEETKGEQTVGSSEVTKEGRRLGPLVKKARIQCYSYKIVSPVILLLFLFVLRIYSCTSYKCNDFIRGVGVLTPTDVYYTGVWGPYVVRRNSYLVYSTVLRIQPVRRGSSFRLYFRAIFISHPCGGNKTLCAPSLAMSSPQVLHVAGWNSCKCIYVCIWMDGCVDGRWDQFDRTRGSGNFSNNTYPTILCCNWFRY